MTNEEILKTALEKVSFNEEVRELFEKMDITLMVETRSYFALIFSHDFAKAFWGNQGGRKTAEYNEDWSFRYIYIPDWQYHLQQMVLEEDPIKYLERFLEE